MRKILFLLAFILLISQVYGQDKYRKAVFLHHSTGGCIYGPNGSPTSVPEEIAGYNSTNGYSGQDACSMDEVSWPETPWNNDWVRWHNIFDNNDPDAVINPYYSSHKIIIIKSCFPSSAMTGWGMPSDTNNPTRKSVYNYKWHWRNFVRVMESHPDIFFVIWTNAPLVAASTDDDQAFYSHHFCKWAKDTLARGWDPGYGQFPDNVYVFDFFHKLVGQDYKLQAMYAQGTDDSHPNAAATELVAPQFVDEVFDAAIAYEPPPGELLPPEILYPEYMAENIPVEFTFRWSKVPGATDYMFQLADNINFNNVLIEETLQDTTFDVSGLQNSKTYYWRVKSLIGQERQSVWSLKHSFTTIMALPQPPPLISPENEAVQVDINTPLIWGHVEGADDYRVQLARDPEFQYRVINTNFINDTIYDGPETLDFNSLYYWRVKCRNIAGESEWSQPFTFTTIMPDLEAPLLTSPDSGASNLNPFIQLIWKPVPDAIEYTLQVKEADGGEVVLELDDLTDTVYSFTADYDMTYEWKVSASNLSGDSPWSETWIFSTLKPLPVTPLMISPKDGAEDVELLPAFTWNSSEWAEEYHFQLATSDQFDSPSIEMYNLTDTIVTLTEDYPVKLNAETQYYWRVTAKNNSGSSEWSQPWSFTTKSASCIEDLTGADHLIHVYPNPLTDELHISTNISETLDIKLILTDSFGRPILNKSHVNCLPGIGNYILNCRDLASGTYFLRIISGDIVVVRRILVVK